MNVFIKRFSIRDLNIKRTNCWQVTFRQNIEFIDCTFESKATKRTTRPSFQFEEKMAVLFLYIHIVITFEFFLSNPFRNEEGKRIVDILYTLDIIKLCLSLICEIYAIVRGLIRFGWRKVARKIETNNESSWCCRMEIEKEKKTTMIWAINATHFVTKGH